ncbi:MAG TPA: hypothetical protein VF553_20865 [Pyrinomonadaceae bacterium]|jgi:hypothetical protein
MDPEYQRRLVADGFVQLQRRIIEEGLDIGAEMVGGLVFARIYGAAGQSEPYQLKIGAGQYPVGPWRVGFINPEAEGEDRLSVHDRDPRYWPFSGLPGLNGGFHISYPGPFRVFICHPFTSEFFYYHGDERWDPWAYDLARVVIQLSGEVKKADHFSKWYPLVLNGRL